MFLVFCKQHAISISSLFECGNLVAHPVGYLRATTAGKRALAVAEKKIDPICPEVALALELLVRVYDERAKIRATRLVRSTTD